MLWLRPLKIIFEKWDRQIGKVLVSDQLSAKCNQVSPPNGNLSNERTLHRGRETLYGLSISRVWCGCGEPDSESGLACLVQCLAHIWLVPLQVASVGRRLASEDSRSYGLPVVQCFGVQVTAHTAVCRRLL